MFTSLYFVDMMNSLLLCYNINTDLENQVKTGMYFLLELFVIADWTFFSYVNKYMVYLLNEIWDYQGDDYNSLEAKTRFATTITRIITTNKLWRWSATLSAVACFHNVFLLPGLEVIKFCVSKEAVTLTFCELLTI
jgi:hypothetical protein